MEPPAVVPVVVVVPPVVVPEEPPVVVEPPGALLAVWAEASCLKEAREREALAAVLWKKVSKSLRNSNFEVCGLLLGLTSR